MHSRMQVIPQCEESTVAAIGTSWWFAPPYCCFSGITDEWWLVMSHVDPFQRYV